MTDPVFLVGLESNLQGSGVVRICQEQGRIEYRGLQAEGAARRLAEALRRVQVYKDSLRSSCTLSVCSGSQQAL